MAARHGVVLTFKEGMTKEQIAEALAELRDILDLPKESVELVSTGTVTTDDGIPSDVATLQPKSFEMKDIIHEFDDEEGGPVWYLP